MKDGHPYRYYLGVLIPVSDRHSIDEGRPEEDEAYDEDDEDYDDYDPFQGQQPDSATSAAVAAPGAARGAAAGNKLYVHGSVVDEDLVHYELVDMEDELCSRAS